MLRPATRETIFPLLALFLLCLLLSACNTTQYLDYEERFLKVNEIEFQGEVKRRAQLESEMYALYKQRPNRKFFGVSRRYFYYKTSEPGDTTAFKKALRKQAEAPAIFDPLLAVATGQNMENYLRNRGYFDAAVRYEKEELNRQKMGVKYIVTPGPLYTIKRVRFESEDTDIEEMLREVEGETVLEPGKPVDSRLYDQEVRRITDYLRNQGYAYFYPNSIAPLEADSIGNQVDATLAVLPPGEGQTHQVFTVGRVTISPEYNLIREAGASDLIDTLINGFHFIIPPGHIRVQPQVILDHIYLEPGALYRQSSLERTNRALGTLGTYRFVNIQQVRDDEDPNVINFNILLTPGTEWEIGADLDFSFNNNSAGRLIRRQNLIGISISPTLKSRNLLGGAEAFSFFGDFGIEVDPFSSSGDSVINTLDIRLQADLGIPRFTDYLRFWRLMNGVGITGDRFYQRLAETGTTQLSTAYNYISLLNFYSYNSFDFRYGFNLLRQSRDRLLVNHLGIDILIPQIQPNFQAILDENPFLAASFGRQLFTGFVFRDLSYQFTTPPTLSGRTYTFVFNGELSGHEVLLANKIRNAISGSDEAFLAFRELRFSTYARVYGEARYRRPLTTTTSIGARVVVAAAAPYGFSEEVPYVKQYFVGGPTSMRGWRERELGPGGYNDPTVDDDQRRFFFQTGDLRLEANFEYRFRLLRVSAVNLESALFLDAGNVWTFKEDPERIGSQFRLRRGTLDGQTVEPFYQQIAVNTGVGFRLDFSYFLLRVDAGIKLRQPYEDPDNGGYWLNFDNFGVFRTPNYSLMLGLPF